MNVVLPFDSQGRDSDQQPWRRLVLETCIATGAVTQIESNWSIWVWVGHLSEVLAALGERVRVVGYESCTFVGILLQARLDYNETYSPALGVAEAIHEAADWFEEEPGLFLEIYIKLLEPIEIDSVIDLEGFTVVNSSRSQSGTTGARVFDSAGSSLLVVPDEIGTADQLALAGWRMLIEACVAERVSFRLERDQSVWIHQSHLGQVMEALGINAQAHGLRVAEFDGPGITRMSALDVDFDKPIPAREVFTETAFEGTGHNVFVQPLILPASGSFENDVLDLSFLKVRPRGINGVQN